MRPDQSFELHIQNKTEISFTGPAVPPEANGQTVPFQAQFILHPEQPDQPLNVTCQLHRGTVPYTHQFPEQPIPEERKP